MRPLCSVWLLLAMSCFSAAAVQAPAEKAARPRITTVMYLVDRPDSIASLAANAARISIVAPQSFRMDAEGFIGGEVPPQVLEIARRQGVAIMPLVTNGWFGQPTMHPDTMHAVLDNPEARARAIRYLLYYCLRDGYIGIQFDYENIHYTYRDKFSDFFRETARAFRRHGLLLSAAVVGKQSDEKPPHPSGYDYWSGVYDYRALGREADFLSIMAYPQHGAFSDPGPISSYPWVDRILEFTLSQVPRRKVSLALPLYGTHWTALAAGDEVRPAAFFQEEGPGRKKWSARSVGFPDVALLFSKAAPEWSAEHSAHRLVFVEGDRHNEVWYEDASSLSPKIQLSADRRLHGISAWVLGREDPELWRVLAEKYRVQRVRAPAVKGTRPERARAAAARLSAR